MEPENKHGCGCQEPRRGFEGREGPCTSSWETSSFGVTRAPADGTVSGRWRQQRGSLSSGRGHEQVCTDS